jgi:hypothetical protein
VTGTDTFEASTVIALGAGNGTTFEGAGSEGAAIAGVVIAGVGVDGAGGANGWFMGTVVGSSLSATLTDGRHRAAGAAAMTARASPAASNERPPPQ